MSKRFEDFIHLPYEVLKTVGYDFLDKPKSIWRKRIMTLYLIACLLCCIYVTYYILIATMNELLAGVQNAIFLQRLLTDIIYNIVGFLKFFCFVRHIQQNKKMCKMFGDMFPNVREERKLYRTDDYFWPKWIKGILYFYFCAVLLIVFSPLIEVIIEYLVQYFKVGYENAKFGYLKLYEITYTIDHHNPRAYILVYIVEIMNAHFAIVFNICPDIWLVAYAMQLCMHFDYVARTLEAYKPLEEESIKDCQFMGVIVKKHQILLNLSDSLREIFSVLILIMFLSTAVILCCVGVYVITQGVSGDLLGFLAFIPTTLGQYLIVCYYGQQIINTSLNVCDAAYNSSWYVGSQSYKKSILVILVRSQRQAEFNAGGFHTTNLEAFQMVISLTYRAYALLNTMFD